VSIKCLCSHSCKQCCSK